MDLQSKTLGPGVRPALVLVDMINGFTDPDCPLGSHCDDVVAANVNLVREFRRRGLPVVFTTVVYHDQAQARVFREKIPALNVLVPGSHWVQVDARLHVQPGDVLLEKQWASGFHRTDLDKRLHALGVDSLVVTGLTTSGCVRATVVDGLQHDYRVIVPREAVGDRNAEAHAANLHDMHAKYADVLSLQEVVDSLP